MKKVIRLTEGDLRRIVGKSVNRILREMDGDDAEGYDMSRYKIMKHITSSELYNKVDPDVLEQIYGGYNLEMLIKLILRFGERPRGKDRHTYDLNSKVLDSVERCNGYVLGIFDSMGEDDYCVYLDLLDEE